MSTKKSMLSRLAVQLMTGENRDISPASALRLRLGRMVWGTDTGLVQAGKPVNLPDEIFYEVADRKVPASGEVQQTVLHNLIRAQMVAVEARIVKAVMLTMFILSMIGGGIVLAVLR